MGAGGSSSALLLRALRSDSCCAAEAAGAGSKGSARGAGLGLCVRGAWARDCAAAEGAAATERHSRKGLRRQARSGRAFAPAATATAASPSALFLARRVARICWPGCSVRFCSEEATAPRFAFVGHLLPTVISPSARRACASPGSWEWSLAGLDADSARCCVRDSAPRSAYAPGAGNGRAQARQRFFCFFLPVRAAETLRGDREPLHGVLISFGFFFDDAELPGNHRVVRALIKLGKFRFCVGAVLRFADTRLNLPPVSHGGHCSSRLRDRPTKGMLARCAP